MVTNSIWTRTEILKAPCKGFVLLINTVLLKATLSAGQEKADANLAIIYQCLTGICWTTKDYNKISFLFCQQVLIVVREYVIDKYYYLCFHINHICCCMLGLNITNPAVVGTPHNCIHDAKLFYTNTCVKWNTSLWCISIFNQYRIQVSDCCNWDVIIRQ